MEALDFALRLGVPDARVEQAYSLTNQKDAQTSQAVPVGAAPPRSSVIHQDRLGDPVALEGVDQDRLDLIPVLRRERGQSQAEAAVVVQQAQGVATPTAAQRKPALEVHLSQLVRSRPLESMHRGPHPLRLVQEARPRQDPVDGPAPYLEAFLGKKLLQLPGAPADLGTQRQDASHDIR